MVVAVVTLCVASLATVVAWTALAASLSTRVPVVRTLAFVAISAPPLLALAGVTVGGHFLAERFGVPLLLRNVSAGLTLVAAMAWIVVAWKGRRRATDSAGTIAATWPAVRLAGLTLAGVAVVALSIVAMDRIRLAQIAERREAAKDIRAEIVDEMPIALEASEAYARAVALLDDSALASLFARDDEWLRVTRRIPSQSAPYSPSDADAVAPFLEALAPAIAATKAASEFPAVDFGFDAESASLFDDRPETEWLRTLVRLLECTARAAAARADREEAIACIVAIDRIASQVVGTPTFEHLLLAISMQEIASGLVAAVAGQVDVSDARILDPTFEADLQRSVSSTVAMERVMVEAMLLDMMTGENGVVLASDGIAAVPGVARVAIRLALLPTEWRAIDDAHRDIEAAVRENRAPQVQYEAAGFFASRVLSPLRAVIAHARGVRAVPALRRAAILVRRTPEGDFDSSDLPVDPFSTSGQRLRAEIDEFEAWVCSVGPNGRAEHGMRGGSADDVSIRMWKKRGLDPTETNESP